MKILFLGTGTSEGIPRIGCDCVVCQDARKYHSKNNRSRSSVLITLDDGHRVLIDTSQDMRTQALKNDIRSIDAILYTHAHADHTLGLPDIREFNRAIGGPIDSYGSEETLDEIKETFQFMFRPGTQRGGGLPSVSLHTVSNAFTIFEQEVIPIPVKHGTLDIFGYRIGDCAYITDASAIPPASKELLAGVKILVLNALRFKKHPTHFSMDEAIEMACQIGAEKTYLTHICHRIDHDNIKLPDGIELAYDGLVIDVQMRK